MRKAFLFILIFICLCVAGAAEQERVTMDLKGIDINELFRVLSLKTGLTIVPSKNVSGRVNLLLNDLALEDALDVILINQDLACDRNGNVINIMTSGEYERLYGKRYQEKRKCKLIKLTYAKPAVIFNALTQMKSDIGRVIADESTGTLFLIDVPQKIEAMEKVIANLDRPLDSDIFYLKYAKASEAKEHLTKAITPGAGELIVDERINKVMVYDFPERIKRIRQLVKEIDVEPEQVFIEAEFVIVRLRDEYQRGVDWKKYGTFDWIGKFPVATSFSPTVALTADYSQVSVGILSEDDYTLTLQMLETFGEAHIINRQNITVVNKNEARVNIISKEPFVQQALETGKASTITADKVEFIEVGVKFAVKPEINKDEFVTLTISAEVSSVKSVTITEQSYVPIVEKSTVEGTVKIKNGTRLLVAGLGGYDLFQTLAGPPGEPQMNFWGSASKRTRREEFVIFIKPFIHLKKGYLS